MRRLSLLGLVVLLAACGGKSAVTTNQTTIDANGCVVMTAPPAETLKEAKPTSLLDTSKTYDAVIDTNCGSFTIHLDPAQSPHTVASFVSLAQKGFYDHTIFHRIAPGFVIQGGDPTQTGEGGPGYTTVDTPPSNASYTLGVVAMAKTGAQAAGTSGSQFFIVTTKNAGLPADYAIIGKVTAGLAVVKRIGALGDANEQPTEVVEIERATISS